MIAVAVELCEMIKNVGYHLELLILI